MVAAVLHGRERGLNLDLLAQQLPMETVNAGDIPKDKGKQKANSAGVERRPREQPVQADISAPPAAAPQQSRSGSSAI